ncbi:glycoside hydrolase family 5 protein [Rickenella mellea]|uniref:Glycoside hydrolase family 5 protein n=1 Tax=Rickenella mellea TaxID=50990 RepID=A0A4Y7PNV5_9AGAM|nr:glycoside hydrolase family 5 protein [Rickenella mellea]
MPEFEIKEHRHKHRRKQEIQTQSPTRLKEGKLCAAVKSQIGFGFHRGTELRIRQAESSEAKAKANAQGITKFLEYFFQDDDVKFFKSLGLNCIRIPFNYRHFEDDMNPRVLKTDGFKHLDCDLHAAPGGQNTDWHCDSGSHVANFWLHKDFQDRAVWLWEELAKHYKDNTWIAGYNPLNEPTDASHTRVVDFYNRVHTAIRTIDQKHVIFWDGNTFASDFSHFGDMHKRWTNSAYSIHDYTEFGFPSSKETYSSTDEQRKRIRKSYEKKKAWMDERGLCVWNGEFGPVYTRKEYDGDKTDEINKSRYKVLKDQLDMYKQDSLSWSIWLYKDIGFQGMVYVSRSTPYMELFNNFLAKKQCLAIDAWGADKTYIQPTFQPIIDLLMKEVVPDEIDQRLYPWPVWKLPARVGRLGRNLLFSEYMIKEWAEHFRGKGKDELDLLAQSFKFDCCVHRDGLNKVLTDHASLE